MLFERTYRRFSARARDGKTELMRACRRALYRAAAPAWLGTREALRAAVRRALAPLRRAPGLMLRLARDSRCAAAFAGALLAAAHTPGEASPPINLSAVASGTGGFVVNGVDEYDQSGEVLAGAGDVNGDGLADLIIGAEESIPFATQEPGKHFIVFGKAGGAAVSVSDIQAGTGGFVVNGPPGGYSSGMSCSAAGDMNGDGLADLLIGMRLANPGLAIDAGKSYLVFGKADGAAVELSAVEAGTGGFVINGRSLSGNGGEFSGASTAPGGDINGDGIADLILGAPGLRPGGAASAGGAFVVFGKTDTAAVDLAVVASGTGGFIINGIDALDTTGADVSGGGDVNGDGLADIVLSSRFADQGAVLGAGEAYVVFGKADGAAVDLASVAAGTGGFVINGIDQYDKSGNAVSFAGDVNGDGLADLIVGAYEADPGGRSTAGESYVVFGKTGGAAVELSDVAAGTGGFVINGIDADDISGKSVSGGEDINGDGLADLIVGAYFADPGGRAEAGEGYVVFGKTDGAAVELSAVAGGAGGFMMNGIVADDRAGQSSSAAGDVNGDGLADVLLGAYRADPGSMLYAGQSYVVFSPETPPLAAPAGIPASAVYTGRSRAGDGPGGGKVPATAIEDARVTIDFSDEDSGAGGGLAGASLETVMLTRSKAGISNLGPAGEIANVVWEISTDRANWSSATVTLKYLNLEIDGISAGEGSLAIHTAPSLAGPWTMQATTNYPERNEVSATVTGFSFFAVAPKPNEAGPWSDYE